MAQLHSPGGFKGAPSEASLPAGTLGPHSAAAAETFRYAKSCSQRPVPMLPRAAIGSLAGHGVKLATTLIRMDGLFQTKIKGHQD